MAGPDGNQYESYQNESETTTLLSSPSPPASPRQAGKKKKGPTTEAAHEDVRKHYKYALGTGYMFAMGVCGIVLVALGSTLDDLAENSGSTATDVRKIYRVSPVLYRPTKYCCPVFDAVGDKPCFAGRSVRLARDDGSGPSRTYLGLLKGLGP